MLFKNKIAIKVLEFFNRGEVNLHGLARRSDQVVFGGLSNQDHTKKAIPMAQGVSWKRSWKRQSSQIFMGASATITNGIAAVGQTQILALTTLAAASADVTTFVAQPDCPRAVRAVAAKSGATAVGDGSFSTSTGRVLIVYGTDQWGESIVEEIPLNDTTAVVGKKAFATITKITMPAKINATGDQVSVGYSNVLGIVSPLESSADALEFARKASAATAYTTEAMGTLDVGYAATTVSEDVDIDETSVTITSATGFPDGAQVNHARLEGLDGSYEDVIITNRSTTTLTLKRGANGTTARAWPSGTYICWRSGNTIAPASITANDRFKIQTQSAVM